MELPYVHNSLARSVSEGDALSLNSVIVMEYTHYLEELDWINSSLRSGDTLF